MAPGFAGTEIDDYERVVAFLRTVRYIGDTLAGGGEARSKVETNIVEVLNVLLGNSCDIGSWVLRTESDGAAVGEKTMVLKTVSLLRLTPINFGPPYEAGALVPSGSAARPVSRIQSLSAGSMTTD